MIFAFPVNICRSTFLKRSPYKSTVFSGVIEIQAHAWATQMDLTQTCESACQFHRQQYTESDV